jgi:predicted Zn-dependent protease
VNCFNLVKNKKMAQHQRYYGGTGDPYSRDGRGTGTGRFKLFLIIGLAMAGYQVVKYFGNTQVNPLTGESQRIQWSVEEEIALGLQSAPQMAQQYGGLHPDQRVQQKVDEIGRRLVDNTSAGKTPYPFDFHVLADDRTVNAFALPGGQCFITAGLLSKVKNEDQIAGVMGHELAHVVYRHGGERMAKSSLIQGLIQSVLIGSGGSMEAAQIANFVGNMTSLKYGRDQELQSDDFGVKVMIEAGYDPSQMIGVMDILEEASGGASNNPEWQSSHPHPENRREKIKESIKKHGN